LFFDFSDHAVTAARARGYDVEAMRRDCLALMADPAPLIEQGLDARPGFADLQRFKADLTVDLVRSCRAALPSSMRLVAHAFPPPWSDLSGMDFARVAAIADDIAVKLYTMHWPMMLQNYRRHFTDAGIAERLATERLLELFDTGGGSTFRYPEPDEDHPASAEAQARKIKKAKSAAAGQAKIVPSAHAYGPTEDVLRRVATALAAGDANVWINRYGYLGNDKLTGLGRIVETS
jgi:hypothetical protein